MKIICYGDSNTYGYDPQSWFWGRYDACWVDLLAQKSGWAIINDGMNGRRIPDGPLAFPEDTDLLILMLGTNDLLSGLTVTETAQRMRAFWEKMTLPREKILLIAPPPMQRGEWVPSQGLIEASTDLAAAYRTLAQQLGIGFLDSGSWSIPLAYDGVHFTKEGHRRFAEGLHTALISK